ncbi:trypsin-like serine protease, partial [Streptomyces sp. SID3343]|nr:trypsin-like serine protease [Streptomyces sp. SID3343]
MVLTAGSTAGATTTGTTATAASVGAPSTDGPRPIIGGGYAQNAPWAARLFSAGQQTCTSTIIAPTWILTAKHCVSGGQLTFRIGSLD